MLASNWADLPVDIDFPYAGDDARLRLLYRLPVPRSSGELLIVGDRASERILSLGWDGPVQVVRTLSAVSGEAAFDVVNLPGLDASASMGTDRLLARVFRALRPGGWAVGHVEHACTLHGLVAGRGWGALFAPARSVGRPQGCSLALRRAGFAQPSLWYVMPSIQSPMGLIPAEPVAGRAQFVRLARAGRGTHGLWGHAVRLALARIGFGGLLQGQLFFWAQRPC